MKSKLSALVLVVVLTALAATPIAAAPSAAPCTPGASYNPACDVNQDGAITILDVQLTAGHWNRTGTFVSDNNHSHLGQTWIGASNPLKIQGAYGAPDYAPIVLSNTAGHGLAIPNASVNGIYVGTTGFYGMVVNDAALDGVYVNEAGNPSSATLSNQSNGFEVAGAQGYGLYVGRADVSGVQVQSAGQVGVRVISSNVDGVYVDSAGEMGVYVFSAGDTGVDVTGNDLAGYFVGNIQVTGNCTGCLLATFGVNAGDKPLAPGDLVSLAGLRESGVDSVPMLMEVQAVTGGEAVVGVVQGWAELITEEEPRPTEIGLRLVPREGPADPGQYVTIAYSGLTQVKASGPIAQGSKLAVGTDGAARALRTVTLDGVELAENASIIGVALEPLAAGDGLIWVLVNVQ